MAKARVTFSRDGSIRRIHVDLRDRCKRCNRSPRGKMQTANWNRYKPFCSYNCQEWFRLEEAQRYIDTIRSANG